MRERHALGNCSHCIETQARLGSAFGSAPVIYMFCMIEGACHARFVKLASFKFLSPDSHTLHTLSHSANTHTLAHILSFFLSFHFEFLTIDDSFIVVAYLFYMYVCMGLTIYYILSGGILWRDELELVP